MTGWLIETLIATTLLMLAVLAVREAVARRFGAAAAYALWLAPALRMVLPPLPSEWLGTRDQAVVAIIDVVGTLPSQHSGAFAAGSTTDWPLIVLLIWSIGAVTFFGWHIWRYVQFTDRARHSADWLHAEDRVEVATSAAVTSPVAFGIFSKTVMLPADFETRYDATEQRLALAHEVAHHRRQDLTANLAALVMLSLHWFNPLAHWAFRAFRTDQEAACDAEVLKETAPSDWHAYGTALYKSATAGTPLAACATAATATLKVRLSRIALDAGKSPSRLLFYPAMLGICGLVALTASREIVEAAPILIAQERPSGAPQNAQAGSPQEEAVDVAIRADVRAPSTRAKRRSVLTAHARNPLPSIRASGLAVAEAPTLVPPLETLSTPDLPELGPAPAIMALRAAHLSCAGGDHAQTLISEVRTEDGPRREVRIIVCTGQVSEARLDSVSHDRLKAKLIAARTAILKDQVLDGLLRQRILATLDRKIEGKNIAPQPAADWAQPVPLQ